MKKKTAAADKTFVLSFRFLAMNEMKLHTTEKPEKFHHK